MVDKKALLKKKLADLREHQERTLSMANVAVMTRILNELAALDAGARDDDIFEQAPGEMGTRRVQRHRV